MSLHDPAQRPWRNPAGARAFTYGGWAVAAAAASAQGWFVSDLAAKRGLLWTITFFAALGLCVGAMLLDAKLARSRDTSEATAVARMFGAMTGGTGLGMLADPESAQPITSALLLLSGLALFFGPLLVSTGRRQRERRHAALRRTGAAATAVITDVHTFYRGGENVYPHYRVTLKFTDREGRTRWHKETAPPEITSGDVRQGRTLPLHYDPARHGRRRSTAATWSRTRRF